MRNDPYGLWGRTRWRREAGGLVPLEEDVMSVWAWRLLRIAVWGGALALSVATAYGIGFLAGWMIYGS